MGATPKSVENVPLLQDRTSTQPPTFLCFIELVLFKNPDDSTVRSGMSPLTGQSQIHGLQLRFMVRMDANLNPAESIALGSDEFDGQSDLFPHRAALLN